VVNESAGPIANVMLVTRRTAAAIVGLGALAGETVVVRATGDDAEAAAKAVAEVLRTAE
jgi:phosphocarrier protein HPr